MIGRSAATALTILLMFTACEKKEQTALPAEPAPAPGQPAPEQPAQESGWKDLPGADQLTYQIDLQEGEKIYGEVCATCHRDGIAGAPKLEEQQAWKERAGKGLPVLIENSIKGYQGSLGVMPPKGGAQSLTDQQVASTVVYMVQKAKQEGGVGAREGEETKQEQAGEEKK